MDIFFTDSVLKKLFLGILNACLTPDCEKNVDILDQANALGIISNLPLSDPKIKMLAITIYNIKIQHHTV